MPHTEALHRVWAEALFELAKDAGKTDEFDDELACVAQMFRDVPKLRSFILSPNVDKADKAKALDKALKGKLSPLVFNFLQVALAKGRLAELPRFSEAYASMVDVAGGRQRVRVTSAVELTEDLTKQVQATLEAQLGKQVIVQSVVDPAILGGLVIHYGDTRVDGSVRRRLAEFHKQLRLKIRQPVQS